MRVWRRNFSISAIRTYYLDYCCSQINRKLVMYLKLVLLYLIKNNIFISLICSAPGPILLIPMEYLKGGFINNADVLFYLFMIRIVGGNTKRDIL